MGRRGWGPRDRPGVINEHSPGSWLKSERNRIAQTERPDGAVRAGGGTEEWIVRWNGSVRVVTKYFSEAITEALGIGAIPVVPHAGVKFAVGPEMDRAAVVSRIAAQIVEIDQHHRAAGDGDIAVRGKATDPIMRRWNGGSVVNVNKIIGGEVWIESHAQQPAFSRGIDGQFNEGRVQKVTVLIDDAKLTCPLADKEPAVGRERHRGRIRRARGETETLLAAAKVARKVRGAEVHRSQNETQQGETMPSMN